MKHIRVEFAVTTMTLGRPAWWPQFEAGKSWSVQGGPYRHLYIWIAHKQFHFVWHSC